MRRKKPTEKQKLADKCIDLWKELFMKDCCEVCGGNWHLTGHHYYTRSSYKFLIYEKDNCVTLCGGCHFQLHSKADPKKVEDKIVAVRGKVWLNRIKKKALKRPLGTYLTLKWYQDHLKRLKKIKNKLKIL